MNTNDKIQIKDKSWLKQMFCRHDYKTGVLSKKSDSKFNFECISGYTLTTVCVKCGKIKSKEFISYD